MYRGRSTSDSDGVLKKYSYTNEQIPGMDRIPGVTEELLTAAQSKAQVSENRWRFLRVAG